MGASQSTANTNDSNDSKSQKNLTDVIDYLATDYILTQSFQDMVNLRDPKYCNDLVILTSDIIGEYLNEDQICFLHQKMKDGVEVNEIKEDSVLWVKDANLKNLSVKNKVPKQHLCMGIAKQYVKIAHLFGAIVTTINPTYTYKDSYGITKTIGLKDKNLIPSYAETKLQRINICSERINALVNGKDLKSSENISIQPNFCSMNVVKDDNGANQIKSLNQEPGIPELEMLYQDCYDYSNGKFTSMSEEMQKKYNSDVELFYKAFTGNPTKPDTVKTFSDIRLRDFASSEGCAPGSVYTVPYEGTSGQELFKKYAAHIQTMINTAQTNQNALLGILDQVFVWTLIEGDVKKKISINPKLDEKTLDNLITNARNLIIKCYITCEEDFIKGLEIFEAIVEKQIMDVTKSQIDRLEKTIQDTLAESPTNNNPTSNSNPNN